jgi:hypothetical protein
MAKTTNGQKIAEIVAFLTWVFTELLGWAGGLFILYSILMNYWQDPLKEMEGYIKFLSSLLTLIGTGITAFSIYFAVEKVRPPWKHSKYFFAPLAVIASGVGIYCLFLSGELPQITISGFSMLAISGGLKRLLPYPRENSGQ